MYPIMIRYSLTFASICVIAGVDFVCGQDRTVQFDSGALATTVTTMNSTAMFDSIDSPIRETLDTLSKRYLLKFETKQVENQIARSVTQKAQKTIGQTLVAILGQINCTFAIRPDGVVVIQPDSNLSTRSQKPPTRTRIQQYVEALINQYDKDYDKKLSRDELDFMRRRPPESVDVNKDGYLEAVELLNYYDRTTSGSGSAIDSASQSKIKEYVQQLIETYDSNKDGSLNKEEMAKMRHQLSSSVDLNNDGLANFDELLQYYIRTLKRR